MKWLGLAAGGIAGTFTRYFLSIGIYGILGSNFPYGTIAVNLTGCTIIGFLAAIPESRFPFGMDGRLAVMAGFCGAFTTFSAFILETFDLMKTGQPAAAVLNVAISIAAGLILFGLGFSLGKAL